MAEFKPGDKVLFRHMNEHSDGTIIDYDRDYGTSRDRFLIKEDHTEEIFFVKLNDIIKKIDGYEKKSKEWHKIIRKEDDEETKAELFRQEQNKRLTAWLDSETKKEEDTNEAMNMIMWMKPKVDPYNRMRVGQYLDNVLGEIKNQTGQDIFYMENDVLIEELKKVAEKWIKDQEKIPMDKKQKFSYYFDRMMKNSDGKADE